MRNDNIKCIILIKQNKKKIKISQKILLLTRYMQTYDNQ